MNQTGRRRRRAPPSFFSRRIRMSLTRIALLVAVVALIVVREKTGTNVSAAPTTAPSTNPTKIEKVVKTDAEWKKILSADQYYILREKGTEPPFHNAYWDNHEKGVYFCAGCGLELFRSSEKFESGTGWPSFWTTAVEGHVLVNKDADGE